jgi:hypothetical protein
MDEIDTLAHEFAAKANVTTENEAEGKMSDPNIYNDPHEIIPIDLEDGSEPVKAKRILFAISDCVTGKTNAVERYLNSSDETGIFLHGRDYESNTTLILAAAEETSTMVSLLLRHGVKINSVNRYGRSALMEAALWGKLDNVKLLLENGADRNLRDNGNRLANDLAQSTQKNRRERYVRAGGDISSGRKPVYQEDTFKRDNDRRGITRLLEGVDTKSKVVYGNLPTISQYEGYSFKRSPLKDSIVLRGPVENYPVTSPRKTVARLERGGKFPPIAAMSGWSHSSWPSLRVNGQQWTKEVFYISSLVGHTLPCDENNQGQRGKYYAADLPANCDSMSAVSIPGLTRACRVHARSKASASIHLHY